MKRKFNEIHLEYKQYKKDEKEIKLLYETVKKEYLRDKKLSTTLEKIYLKNKLEDYKGDTYATYFNILIVVITTIVTIILEKNILEASNYIVSIIAVLIIMPIMFIGLLKLDKKIIRKEIDKNVYYNLCLDVIKELEEKSINTK